MTSELLQHVRLLDPISAIDRVADVLIVDGVIRAIDSIADYPSDTHVQDCRGWVLGPGLVDLYSHSGEPGFEERETLASLLQSARAGGFTRLAILPDTVPALDNPASIAWLHDLQRDRRGPHLYIWAALTIATHGQQMTELAELAALDIIGFADGKPLTNLALVRRLLEYLRSLNKPVALWACEPVLGGNGVMREGADSIRFGLPGIPTIAETLPLAGLLECIEATGTPVHLMKLSTARGVELIRSAKARGLPVTASATWMHLLLDTNALGSYDPSLRLDPPLGTPSDRLALTQAVQEGVIDAIAIDHTSYTYEEKTVAFAEAPPGAIGLELALPLLWHTFVQSGRWSALELWRRLSSDPARCLQQQGPAAIALNQPAELTLFDPQQTWAVEAQSLHCHSSNTPWLGQPIVGRVIKTWCP